MNEPDPLQERIRELQCAAHIAEKLGDLLFAKRLRERAQELKSENEDDHAATLRRPAR